MRTVIAIALVSVVMAACNDPTREARRFSEQHPPSTDVVQLYGDLVKQAPTPDARSALEQEHKAWLVSRGAHCLSLSRLQATGADTGKRAAEDVKTCFGGADNQRADALRGAKLSLLLNAPNVAALKEPAAKLAVTFQRGELPSDIELSPDGTLTAIGKVGGDIEIFDNKTGQLLRVIRTDKFAYIRDLTFSANGRVLFAGSRQNRGLKLYDPYTGSLLRDHEGCMSTFVLLRTGRHVACADNQNVKVYDVASNKDFPTTYKQRGYVTKLALSADGKRLAAINTDRSMTLHDVSVGADGNVALSQVAETLAGDRYHESMLEFSRDGDFLVSATVDGLTRWSVPQLQRERATPMPRTLGVMLRFPGTNQFVFGLYKDQAIAGLLFWDLGADTAAMVNLALGGNSMALAASRAASSLYVATGGAITVVPVPEAKTYRAAAEVIDGLLEGPRAGLIARMPMLRDAARDAAVEAIGVYEPRGAEHGRGSERTRRAPIDIRVGRTERPVVLVLTSYEPVEWRIRAEPGARIRHILLGGTDASAVTGNLSVEITKIGGPYAYATNKREYGAFEEHVRTYVGKGIDRFQGAYAGGEFQIGTTALGAPTVGMAPASPARGEPGLLYKCADAAGRMSYRDSPCGEAGLQDRGTIKAPPGGSSRTEPVSQATTPPTPIPHRPTPPRAAGARSVGAHERVIQCGRTTIVCDASDTVICGGKRVPCN